MSVTKEKGKRQCTWALSSHRVREERKVPGARQPQAREDDKIETKPPPFSSDVLIEQGRGELLSEEVLHKLFHEFCHGRTTNDRGCCIGSIYILQEDGSR